MKYLLLIYDDEKTFAGKSPEDMGPVMQAWYEYNEAITKSGKAIAGDALQSTATATTVRAKDSGIVTTDGPFAETKEQLGGYYLIDVEHLDEALEWASKMPHLTDGGTVEIRPIMVFDVPQG